MLQPQSIAEARVMSEKTLFLAWQDRRQTRAWFPIGRLDVLNTPRSYRFRYTKGAEVAQAKAGFEPLLDFPDWKQDYTSSELFPLFQNRVISSVPLATARAHGAINRCGIPEGSSDARCAAQWLPP